VLVIVNDSMSVHVATSADVEHYVACYANAGEICDALARIAAS
jgi:hypothetical protein